MNYLNSTYYFDYNTKEIQNLIKEFKTDALTPKEKAIKLYVKIKRYMEI